MSRYVEITKDGNNYTVNPNATVSSETIAYCWHMSDGSQEERGVMYFNFDKAPADLTELNQKKALVININDTGSPYLIEAYPILISAMGVESYTRISDTEMEFQGVTFTRSSYKDFTMW